METVKSKAAKIIKLAEFLVVAEQEKRKCQRQGETNLSNLDRTIDVSSHLIYDMLNEATCEEREEIFCSISEYAYALQNNSTTQKMWWLTEPVFTIGEASQNATLNACKIIRPLYDEMCQKNQKSESADPEM